MKIYCTNAPAKINLCLHITGQQPNGYHLLDSLVVMSSFADKVTLKTEITNMRPLQINGPFAAPLSDTNMRSNLILRAAKLFQHEMRQYQTHTLPSISFQLEKNIPVAAGLGGGSSNAAATLHLMARWYEDLGFRVPSFVLLSCAQKLGADVKVCLTKGLQHMSGIGDKVEPVKGEGVFHAILVNPNIEMSTPLVFKTLKEKENQALNLPKDIVWLSDNLIDWLVHNSRNDLENPAIFLQPVIVDILNELQASNGCQIARMSGSGATCFAIYKNQDIRNAVFEKIAHQHPYWWMQATQFHLENQF